MLKKNAWVVLIILLFGVIKLSLINVNELWWDSSVYAGMGKFMWSKGTAGLWEPSRPLVWPLILGFVRRSTEEYILFGKVLETFIAAFCILLTYLIGKELINKKTGLISALLLATSPTFFLFTGFLLSEIASTFFMLLAFYFFIKKRFLLCGILSGAAILTRFLQFLIFTSLVAAVLLTKKSSNTKNKEIANKNKLKNAFWVIFGFLTILAPYLILNWIMYGDIAVPFNSQLFMSLNTGWMYDQPLYFYFLNLLKEMPLAIFAFIGIILLFSKGMHHLTLSFAVPFIFFNSIHHKEMRFLIILLPYLSVITASGFFCLIDKTRKYRHAAKFFCICFILLVLISVFNIAFISAKNDIKYGIENKEYNVFRDYLDKNANGEIWISNPLYAALSDAKIAELIYYPTFDLNRQKILLERLSGANHILIDTCDIPCRPDNKYNDCEMVKKEFIETAKKKFKIKHLSRYGSCEKLIFAKE